MTQHPTPRIVITARLHAWSEARLDRAAWITECTTRHLAGDWGDLDTEDRAANNHNVRYRHGRTLSAYPVPEDLADTGDDSHVWIITDDLADPDTATTILWPSDY